MERTKDMKAQVGRAYAFGERTRGVQDPGATACYHFLNEMVGILSEL
jgi:dihydroxyacetone kinase